MDLNVLSQGSLAMLVMELAKRLYRLIVKNPAAEISQVVYAIALPILNFLAIPLLALLGVTGYELPTDMVSFARMLAQVIVASLVSVLVYNNTLKK